MLRLPADELLLQGSLAHQSIASRHMVPAMARRRCQPRPVQVSSSSSNVVVTDQAVPEGHKGLHGFLYGEQGAEVHEDSSRYERVRGEDDGTAQLDVPYFINSREGQRPMGVYALYKGDGELQYVGFSRNMVVAIKAHLSRVGPELCARVRPMVFANKAMATRAALVQQAQNWIEEAGTEPPGNGSKRGLWEGGERTRTEMLSEAEQEQHEERKLKLRKAMGEAVHDAPPDETPDAAQRRLNLISAVEGDDWSAVIDAQTQGTREPPVVPAHIATPFARASVHRSIGNESVPGNLEMTVQAVDTVLDEVRPYLIADGGNVEVVSVQDGIVSLRLQGACGTCPSSSGTMRMGIERALRAAFGEALLEVRQVDAVDTTASVAAVDAHLDMLRPAIQSYGGSVQVLEVGGGKCRVKYEGPPPIAMGIQAAIKDKFGDIKEVIVVS